MANSTPTIQRDRPFWLDECGAVASARGLTVKEHSYGPFRCTELILNAMPVTVANTTGASFGSQKLYTFPTALISIEACSAYFNIIDWAGEDIGAGGSGDYSIGTTATADATLNSTDVDLLPSSAMLDPFVAGIGNSAAATQLAAMARFDGSVTAKEAHLNVIIDDADVSDAASDTVEFTGRVLIFWIATGAVISATPPL